MTTLAADAGRRAWAALPRVRAWLETVHPAKLLAPAIAVQWLTTLALALVVRHNGWLYYQGGDQLWYYISGWSLAHGQIPPALVGHGWATFLAPLSLFAGPTLVPALPAIVLFDVLVLGPIALLCMYGIGRELGGRMFGYWVTLLWLVVPFIGIKYTDHLYHQRYTELTLPQSFGLTAMADFPSMVAVLVSVYFTLRTISRPDRLNAVAAGLAAGVVIAVKPSNSIFLVGIVLVLAYRRRLVDAALVFAGLLPALLTLALWKYRGLGYVPLFRGDAGMRLALGARDQLVAFNPLHKYIHLDWHHLNLQLQAIKEHFWSLRVIEWIVIAGLIGLARRSLTAFLLVGGWFAVFVVTKGTYAHASIDDASIFRIMMPSYPAFVLLIGSLVFLVPGRWSAMKVPDERPWIATTRRRVPLVAAAACVFALYPLALVAAASPMRGPDPRAYSSLGLIRSVDSAMRLDASVAGRRVHLTWAQKSGSLGTGVLYRIWRSGASNGGAACTPVPHGADDCELTMDDLGAHTGGRYTDHPGRGTWTYRLGLQANWLDDPAYGDVYSVGPPIVVHVR